MPLNIIFLESHQVTIMSYRLLFWNKRKRIPIIRDLSKTRIILHIDMDAFYASVEMSKHPQYFGKPFIVGADPKKGRGRGVVLTANYEARKFGLHSGMPISEAYKRCPHGIYIRPHMELYINTSTRIMELLRRYAFKFQKVSIDEAFLDITGLANNYMEAMEVAQEIQDEIWNRFRITCSIGIGPNKLVAKIASSLHKPSMITVIPPEKVKEFLAPLPVQKIPGIGKKLAERLNKYGVYIVEDLAKTDILLLKRVFGKNAVWAKNIAEGIDRSEVSYKDARKSIGKEITFYKYTKEIAQIMECFSYLAADVYKTATSYNFGFKTVSIKLRYRDYETILKSKTHTYYIKSFDTLMDNIRELFFSVYDNKREVRLIGVRLSNVTDFSKQMKLTEFILK